MMKQDYIVQSGNDKIIVETQRRSLAQSIVKELVEEQNHTKPISKYNWK